MFQLLRQNYQEMFIFIFFPFTDLIYILEKNPNIDLKVLNKKSDFNLHNFTHKDYSWDIFPRKTTIFRKGPQESGPRVNHGWNALRCSFVEDSTQTSAANQIYGSNDSSARREDPMPFHDFREIRIKS